MSQIFDALQRSDAERDGKNPVADTRITDVLRRAERQASDEQPADVADSWNSSIATEPSPNEAEPGGFGGGIATALRSAVAGAAV